MTTRASPFTEVTDGVLSFTDTCNVYLIRAGREAIAIDFGAGDVLEHLADAGIERISAILMTHHHRDQAQGLGRARGSHIYVPPVERDLFERVDEHWQRREIYRNYDVREDRFSLLEPVRVADVLREYRSTRYDGLDVDLITPREGQTGMEALGEFPLPEILTIPTPGHTVGSVTLVADVRGRRVAFIGDLMHSAGKLWSLAATQWTYNGGEGLAFTILSLLDVLDQRPDMLLPSHGAPITDPEHAITTTVDRLRRLIWLRGHNPRLLELRARPYERVLPHLLMNRTSNANSYVLLSDTKKALVVDYGYDMIAGTPAGTDRSSRRPWLATIPALKRDFGIERIDVALATHYHDDHLAGFNLLREVEGTKVWAAANYADILRRPAHYDLPCIWYDAIGVDREIPLGETVEWEGYRLTLHDLPGHTLHAIAIEVEVDGTRVVFAGDQHGGEDLWTLMVGDPDQPARAFIGASPRPPRLLNYIYRNRYRIGDFRRTAELYRRLRPEMLLHGHWPPTRDPAQFIEDLAARAEELERLHEELLPLDDVDLGAEGRVAWLRPYQSEVSLAHLPRTGAEYCAPIAFEAEILNPFKRHVVAAVQVVVPRGWRARAAVFELPLPPGGTRNMRFEVDPAPVPVRRRRVAIDVRIDGRRFGQAAEALVTVR